MEEPGSPETYTDWLDTHCYACGAEFTIREAELIKICEEAREGWGDANAELVAMAEKLAAQASARNKAACELCGRAATLR